MENEGLEAITSPVSTELKNGKQFYTYTKEDVETIEKELKAKSNLVSMCENFAKLVGLKEKDYVELETLITKKLKALENISKAYGDYANHKISEYELIMIVSENTSD